MLFNPEIETLPIDKLRHMQGERLRNQVQTLYARVLHYKRLFDEHHLKPDDIRSVEDIHKIPFTYKSALRDNYPFGLFARPRHEIARLHCSSGTTGKPIVVGYTQNDLDVFSEVVARSLTAAGCGRGMLMQNAYGYGLFTGGLGLHYGAEKLGMTVLPISGGGTDKQLMLMQDFQSDAICCTPSYALTLAEEIRKRGIDLNSLNLKYAVLGAEPWTESIRTEIETKLRVTATNIYGLSEIIGPGVSQEDYEEKGEMYIWEDHFYPEIVDMHTGEPLPHGKQGVLVFTTLTREGSPLLRYYTNDIASLYYDKSGKRTHIKMSPIAGRADDMLIIRGVNLFHTQVESVLEDIVGLSNNYQLIVSHRNTMDEVEVRVEAEPLLYEALASEGSAAPLLHDALQNALKQMQKKIKDNIGLSMKIHLEAPGSIPRSEGGKLSRIMDLRKGR